MAVFLKSVLINFDSNHDSNDEEKNIDSVLDAVTISKSVL